MQVESFTKKCNPPLTNLEDYVLVQVIPFGKPKISAYMITSSFVMDIIAEGLGYLYTPIKTMSSGGLLTPHVSILVSNTHFVFTPVVYLNFSLETSSSPSTRVIIPFVYVSPTIGYSIVVVTRIHRIPFTSSPLLA